MKDELLREENTIIRRMNMVAMAFAVMNIPVDQDTLVALRSFADILAVSPTEPPDEATVRNAIRLQLF